MGNSYKCVDGCGNVRWEDLINVWIDVGMLTGRSYK